MARKNSTRVEEKIVVRQGPLSPTEKSRRQQYNDIVDWMRNHIHEHQDSVLECGCLNQETGQWKASYLTEEWAVSTGNKDALDFDHPAWDAGFHVAVEANKKR